MMKKYSRIFRVFINNAFSYEAQYRRDTILKMIVNLLWVGMFFTVIEVIFSQTNAIAGWSKPEVYLMTVFWIMQDELWVTFFGSNLPYISDIIVEGDMDLMIIKPISTLFLISFQKLLTRGFYRFLTQILILAWLLHRFAFSITPLRALTGASLLLVAVWVNYSISLVLNTLSFWFARIENINAVHAYLTSLGKYPVSVWPKAVRVLLLSAIPMAFCAYIPVATLVGRWPWYGVLYAYILAGLLFFLAVQFWRFALKRYSSASS